MLLGRQTVGPPKLATIGQDAPVTSVQYEMEPLSEGGGVPPGEGMAAQEMR